MFCFAVMAQQDPPLFEDFAKKVQTFASFKLNDHVNIVNTSGHLMAMNDKMQILWNKPMDGIWFIDKFKNNVLIITSSEPDLSKGGVFKGLIIDPANGNTLVEKELYKASTEFTDHFGLFTGEGNFIKFTVRETNLPAKSPGLFSGALSVSYHKKDLSVRSLQIFDLNEKLVTVNTVKPAISNGSFVAMKCNKQGDFFLSWLNGPSIEVYKYDAGKSTPSGQLTAGVDLQESNNLTFDDLIKFTPSNVNSNVLYYGLVYLNGDKDMEFGTGKLDFKTNKKQYVTQVLNKDNLKALEKSFVPVNKKMDDISWGYRKGIEVRHMEEINGILTTVLAAKWTVVINGGHNGSSECEGSSLIVGYDDKLALKFQQILPASHNYPNVVVPNAYYSNKNKLYIVADEGNACKKQVFCILDVNSGQWDKMEYLSKKKISNSDYAHPDVLWFGDSYIVPYISTRLFSVSNFDVDALQLNSF